MGRGTDEERVAIRRRVPGIFKFQALLSFGLGVWLFYPFPENHSALVNAVAGTATLWLLTAATFALFMDGRVSYTSHGFYIRPLGWRPLVGLANEHFVAFDDIEEITPEFPRGGHGTQDWLMFGILQLHTKTRRPEKEDLALYQIFLNRAQLVGVLEQLARTRPGIIDQKVINALAATS
jgi:hypothetical protein